MTTVNRYYQYPWDISKYPAVCLEDISPIAQKPDLSNLTPPLRFQYTIGLESCETIKNSEAYDTYFLGFGLIFESSLALVGGLTTVYDTGESYNLKIKHNILSFNLTNTGTITDSYNLFQGTGSTGRRSYSNYHSWNGFFTSQDLLPSDFDGETITLMMEVLASSSVNYAIYRNSDIDHDIDMSDAQTYTEKVTSIGTIKSASGLKLNPTLKTLIYSFNGSSATTFVNETPNWFKISAKKFTIWDD